MPDGRVRGGKRRAPKASRRIPRRRRREPVALPTRPTASGPDRLAPAARPPAARRKGGARALRRGRRRTQGLPGTLGMTLLGALVPGSGYLYAGRRALGGLLLASWLALLAAVVWYFGRDLRTAVDFAFDPTRLKIAALVLLVGLVVWAFVVFTSYRLVRPRVRPRWHTVAGNLAVCVVCLVVAAPVAMAARNAMVQADLVQTVFQDGKSATTPDGRTEEDPWAGTDRVNVLLLGGDGGEGRTGVRTDTVILMSIDTDSGRTVTFSLPRNMMFAQFPEDSPLHDLYPEGYTGTDDPAFYMLNAIYGQVPQRHPGVLGESDNEGADAVKQAVAGSLGIPVDYYVLVNLAGFKEIVDAIGGITVNINEPVAINGNTDLGIPPTDYLEPGPDQHLDGFHALWFARGRYGSDDYERMERQRCTIDAIIDAADPVTLFRQHQELAEAGKEVVFTDIPRELAPAFVELALKVKDAKMKSVVFRSSEKFYSGDPDYEWMREVVDRAIDPPAGGGKKGNGGGNGGGDGAGGTDEDEDETQLVAEDPADACAYQPTGEVVDGG